MDTTFSCQIIKRSVDKHKYNSTNYFYCETHDRKIYTSREFKEVDSCSEGQEEKL